MKKKINKRIWIGLFLVMAMGLLALSGVLFLKENHSVQLSSAYLYRNGNKISSEGKWKIRNREGNAVLTGKGIDSEMSLSGIPVYLEKENEILLPEAWVLQYPGEHRQYRVEFFSTLKLQEEGILIQDGTDSCLTDHGILYDGKDTYLFLEPVTLVMNDSKQQLPAFSMVRAVYADKLEIYPYGEIGSALDLYPETELWVELSTGIRIYLLSDRVLLENQSWELMICSSKNLNRINTWEE